MLQVVLDTNVIASALRSNRGASHQVLSQIADRRFAINLSVPLVLEYEQTLKRVCPALKEEDVDSLIAYICQHGDLRRIFYLWRPSLPNERDHMVLELAIASQSSLIVSFNWRDLAAATAFGIRVVTPREFLAILKSER